LRLLAGRREHLDRRRHRDGRSVQRLARHRDGEDGSLRLPRCGDGQRRCRRGLRRRKGQTGPGRSRLMAGGRPGLPRLRGRILVVALTVLASPLLLHVSNGAAATIPVSNTEQLVTAVVKANSGDVIVLAPGNYSPSAPLTLSGVTDVTIVGPQTP